MTARSASSSCFPRTRGDGPLPRTHTRSRVWFPPHARGWTPRLNPVVKPGPVSPARAGMDPGRRATGSRSSSFPRTRGDGPQVVVTKGRVFPFPPHARGWTPCSELAEGGPCVSPARAGMDPCLLRTLATGVCFPRTRGDGPLASRTSALPDTFPPHARGWTPWRNCDHRPVGVSPARAGMDRKATPPKRRLTRFPRTRGDGPIQEQPFSHKTEFPPHARGWTRHPLRLRRGAVVSPARAGMDPSVISTVSPSDGFPRTRGDGPALYLAVRAQDRFSPHTRGWTPEHPAIVRDAMVSPARVGMDLRPRRVCPDGGRFPRTRGDGLEPAGGRVGASLW